MGRIKNMVLAALEDGEDVAGWPPLVRRTPPDPPRAPLGSVPQESVCQFWPYHVWMRVGLTPYTRPTTRRSRRRRQYWASRLRYRLADTIIVNGNHPTTE
jgi:hypothetical protein